MAGRVFEHFNGLYRFQGLRRYKEKYSPNWEPRFLVYQKHYSLWESMLKVMRVIRHINNEYFKHLSLNIHNIAWNINCCSRHFNVR